MASNTFVLNLLVFWNYHHHQRSSLTWGRGCSDSSGNTACGRQPHPQWSFPFHRLVFHTGSTYCHPAMTNTWRHNLWHDNLKSHLTCILAACHGCHPLWHHISPASWLHATVATHCDICFLNLTDATSAPWRRNETVIVHIVTMQPSPRRPHYALSASLYVRLKSHTTFRVRGEVTHVRVTGRAIFMSKS